MFLNKIVNTIKQSKKKVAASLAVVIAAMAIIPAVSSYSLLQQPYGHKKPRSFRQKMTHYL